MVYADEDEIDWSDGSFGAPSRIPIDAAPGLTHHNPTADIYEDQDSLFVSETYDQHQIPSGVTLEAGKKLFLRRCCSLTFGSCY